MDSKYVSIKLDEFESFLLYKPDGSRNDFERVDLDRCWEYVYEHPIHTTPLVIRVFSSIDKRTGMSRERGKDAIRVVLVDKEANRGLKKSKRTYRIKGWPERLRLKILGLYWQVRDRSGDFVFCGCGSVMDTLKVKRNSPNKGKRFLKCIRCGKTLFPQSLGW